MLPKPKEPPRPRPVLSIDTESIGDSPMMKLGEVANRLPKLGVIAPDGDDWALAVASRNLHIHQYDEINRELTWLTLLCDLPEVQAIAGDAVRRSRGSHQRRVGGG